MPTMSNKLEKEIKEAVQYIPVARTCLFCSHHSTYRPVIEADKDYFCNAHPTGAMPINEKGWCILWIDQGDAPLA